jgi:hypothetical protein
VLGYRSTLAGLRMFRHRTVCPAGVIVDSSPRSRLLRRDVASRLVTLAASAVAAAGPRRRGLAVQSDHQGPGQSAARLASSRNRSYTFSPPRRYWR